MNESTSFLEQLGSPMILTLLLVVIIASGLFYSASKKFARYFKARQAQDAIEKNDPQ